MIEIKIKITLIITPLPPPPTTTTTTIQKNDTGHYDIDNIQQWEKSFK